MCANARDVFKYKRSCWEIDIEIFLWNYNNVRIIVAELRTECIHCLERYRFAGFVGSQEMWRTERERMFLMSEIEKSVYVFFALRAFYVCMCVDNKDIMSLLAL